jgi:HlyD family secretion protein
MMKRLIAVVIVLAVVGGAAFGAWVKFFRPIEVEVAHNARDVAVQVFGLGTVEARVASQIGFKVAGVLVDLKADVGDRVGKGAVLAKLDDREQQAQVARAKAAVQQAQANLQKVTASVDKATANFSNAKSINERRQKLAQSNSGSIESAETAKTARDTALADLNLANSDVLVAMAAINDAKAQEQLQTVTLDFHTLTAPYDAMVTGRLKELGSALAAGQAVFSLIDPKTIWVLAFIDESKAGEIKVGQPAEIVLRSQPNQRLKGKVARIEPESDRVNEERRIEIAFDTIPDNPNLGEQAEVYVTTSRLRQPLLVPEATIMGLGKGRGTLWTLEGNKVEQREVTLGHRLLDGRYEIAGGLPDGAKVITNVRDYVLVIPHLLDRGLAIPQLRGRLRVGREATVAAEPVR